MAARRLAVPLVTAVLILAPGALAACAPPTQATLTLGAALPRSGSLAAEGKATEQGYQLCVDTVNAKGGIVLGARTVQLRLSVVDDASKAANTAKLVDDFNAQGVKLILGSYGSATTAAEAPVVERNGQLLADSAGADDAIFAHGYKRTFAVLSPASQYASTILLAVAELASPAPRSVAFLSADDGFSKTSTASGVVAAKALGLSVVGSQVFPSGSTDVQAALAKIQPLKPDLVIGSVHLAEGEAIMKQAGPAGLTPLGFGETVAPSTSQFPKQLGATANGVIGSSQWSKTVGGRDDLFGSAPEYDAKVRATFGTAASYQQAQASAACLALVKGLENARTDNPDKVRDALAALDMSSFFGPLRFDSTGKNVTKRMVVIQVQRGVAVTVWPPGAAEAPFVWPSAPAA